MKLQSAFEFSLVHPVVSPTAKSECQYSMETLSKKKLKIMLTLIYYSYYELIEIISSSGSEIKLNTSLPKQLPKLALHVSPVLHTNKKTS